MMTIARAAPFRAATEATDVEQRDRGAVLGTVVLYCDRERRHDVLKQGLIEDTKERNRAPAAFAPAQPEQAGSVTCSEP